MYFSHSPINTYLVAGASEKLYDKAREFCGRQATILFEVSVYYVCMIIATYMLYLQQALLIIDLELSLQAFLLTCGYVTVNFTMHWETLSPKLML